MAFNYSKSRETATRLITRFGQAAVLRQFSRVGDEWAPFSVPADTELTVVDLNERVRDESGTLVGQTRRTLLVSAEVGLAPEKGDKVAVGISLSSFEALTEKQQDSWLAEVSEVRPLSPGGTVVFWELDLAS